jgi:hypothetical protein
MRAGLLVITLNLACSVLAAQESQERPAPPPAGDVSILVSALGLLERPEGCAFEGSATIKKPAINEDETDAMIVHVGIEDHPARSEPFTGAIEAVRTDQGETLLLSKSGLPGFAIYHRGTKTVTRTNFESRPVNPSRLAGDLDCLLKPADLVAAVKSAKLDVQSEDGLTVFRGDLPKRLIKGRRSEDQEVQMFSMAPKVLKVQGEFRVDSQGRLAGLKFSVLRSDPGAALRRRLEEAAEEGGGLAIGPGDLEDLDSDEPGPTSTYALTLAPSGPSARAKSELESLRALAGG